MNRFFMKNNYFSKRIREKNDIAYISAMSGLIEFIKAFISTSAFNLL